MKLNERGVEYGNRKNLDGFIIEKSIINELASWSTEECVNYLERHIRDKGLFDKKKINIVFNYKKD